MLWKGWFAYGIFYFAIVFNYGFLRMDDFGYLRSVTESLAAGRIVTDDWLAPYNAGFTALCSLTYLLTRNFYFSTWGIHALFALANFPLLYGLLRNRLAPETRLWLTATVLSFPIYLQMSGEYAGIVPSLTGFLSALWFWRANHRAGFFLAAAFSISTRQNHIALMVLPAWSVLEGFRQRRELDIGWTAGILACLAGTAALHAYLEPTSFTMRVVYSGKRLFHPGMVLQAFLTGLFTVLAFMSGLNLALGGRFRDILRANLRRPSAPLAAMAILSALACCRKGHLILFHTYLLGNMDDTWGGVQWALLLGYLAAIWAFEWKAFRPGPIPLLILGYLAIGCLRGMWWDYYLLEAFFLSLIYVLAVRGPGAGNPGRATKFLLGACLLMNLAFGFGLKILLDKQKIGTQVFERLERQGSASPENMTGATFGYKQWKLFDHLLALSQDDTLSVFCFGNARRLWVETELPWRRAFLRHPGKILETGVCRIGFVPLHYRAIDERPGTADPQCGPAGLAFDKGAYRPKPFPLSNREWDRFIRYGDSFPAHESE